MWGRSTKQRRAAQRRSPAGLEAVAALALAERRHELSMLEVCQAKLSFRGVNVIIGTGDWEPALNADMLRRTPRGLRKWWRREADEATRADHG